MSKDRAFEDLRSLGEFLQHRVSPEVSERVAARALSKRRPRRSRRRLVVVATAALLAIGNTALARASDAAIPGDLLYRFDRAYEWVEDRFGSQDRVPERVREAFQLAEMGETDRALDLVNEILAAQAGEESLQAAVGGLAGSGNSLAVRNKVKDLVGAASLVHEAAQTGDHQALQEAIATVKEEAALVAETASDGNAGGNGNGGGPDPDSPSVTAPGQTENPAVTAPGQDDSNPGNSGGQGGGGQGGPKP